MVAAHNHNVAALSLRDQVIQERVILLLHKVRRRGGIEYVAGNDQKVDGLFFNGKTEPIEKFSEGVVSSNTEKGPAQMQVGSVQNAHVY